MIEDKSTRLRQSNAGGDTGRLKVGSLQFDVGLSYEVELADNVNSSEFQGEGDFIQRPQLDLQGFLPVTKTGQLSLGFGIGYAKYADHPDLDRLFLLPDSELAYDFSAEDFIFTFYDRFNYSQEVESVGSLSGIAQFPRFENTIGTRVTWVPSRWTYQAGYAHFNFISAETNFNHLDRSSEQFFARVAYEFAPATQAGLETSMALSDYDSPVRADNNSYSVGPYVEWQLTEAFTLSARGGFTYFTFDSISTPGGLRSLSRRTAPEGLPGYSFDTYYAGLEIDHKLTDFISHGLSYVHEVSPGVNQGSDYLESTVVNYRAHWSLSRDSTAGVTLLYEQGTESQAASPGSIAEEYQRFGAGISGSHKISKRITATVSYNYLRRTSNEAGRSPYQNRAIIGLRYHF